MSMSTSDVTELLSNYLKHETASVPPRYPPLGPMHVDLMVTRRPIGILRPINRLVLSKSTSLVLSPEP